MIKINYSDLMQEGVIPLPPANNLKLRVSDPGQLMMAPVGRRPKSQSLPGPAGLMKALSTIPLSIKAPRSAKLVIRREAQECRYIRRP